MTDQRDAHDGIGPEQPATQTPPVTSRHLDPGEVCCPVSGRSKHATLGEWRID